VPTITRSGRMKSSIAAPSFRNSGFDTQRRLQTAAWQAAIVLCTCAAPVVPVPTGTVDDLVTTIGVARRGARLSNARPSTRDAGLPIRPRPAASRLR